MADCDGSEFESRYQLVLAEGWWFHLRKYSNSTMWRLTVSFRRLSWLSDKLGVLSSFKKPSLSLAENVLQELRYHECSMYF